MIFKGRNRIDRRFQAEVDRLRPEPVRWEHVQRRVRRRRLFAFLGLVLLAIGLTILLAGGLLAGRTALDPTFSPPIFSRSSVSGHIAEPKKGRELVPAKRAMGIPGVEAARSSNELGYIVTARVRLTDLQESRGQALWSLRSRKGEERLSRSVLVHAPAPNSNSEARTLRAWIPMPSRSGHYVVELRLGYGGEATERFRSQPFNAMGKSCCRQYNTPSYTVAVPTGWHLHSDYVLASAHRYVSRLDGPEGMAVVIDTTLHEQGDPLDDQRVLESVLAQGSERYRRLGIRKMKVHGGSLVEWSYRSGKNLYANELFYRGADGYAVLGSSVDAHYREVRDIVRRIARGLRDHQET